ncbi:hypothetical protein [Rhizobium freirei]|nr:hypothetical protein [Rhizobium freirei]
MSMNGIPERGTLAPAFANAFADDGIIGCVGLIAKGGNDCGT